MNPITIEREDPLWETIKFHRSCQSVIKTNVPLTDDPAHKEFYCKDMENELKSYHNKTN